VRELPLIRDGQTAEAAPHDAEGPIAVGPDYAPRKTADVLELDLEDGTVLYNRRASLVHRLNPSAEIVWRLSDGSASVRQLAEDIAAIQGLDSEEVERQIAGFVGELEVVGLVEDAGRDGQGDVTEGDRFDD
jgi:PqqD family protein of HPr-rel-A system